MEDFSNNDEIPWTEESKKRLKNAPEFVQKGILKLMAIRAKQKGMKEITSEFLSKIRDESMKCATQRMKNMGFEELQMKAFGKAKEKMKNLRKKEVIGEIESFLGERTGKNKSIIQKFERYFNDQPSESNGISWTQEATDRLSKAPPFVRPMARKAIEDYAEKNGCKEITPDLIKEIMENLIPPSVKKTMGIGNK